MPKRERFDLGLLVPLQEEFQWVQEVLPVEKEHQVGGEYYYVLSVPDSNFRIIARVIDQMGLVTAAVAADRLCTRFRFPVLALLGLAGGLDDDVQLGDVVIAEQILHYLHAGKAEDETSPGIALGGMTWTDPAKLLEFMRNFGDEHKSTLDAVSIEGNHRKAAFRRYATISASRLLAALCRDPDFSAELGRNLRATRRGFVSISPPKPVPEAGVTQTQVSLASLEASLTRERDRRSEEAWEQVRAFRRDVSQ